MENMHTDVRVKSVYIPVCTNDEVIFTHLVKHSVSKPGHFREGI